MRERHSRRWRPLRTLARSSFKLRLKHLLSWKAMSSHKVFLRRLLCGVALTSALLSRSFAATAPVSGYQIVARFPHSTASYTEGFFYLDSLFYEGTGLEGRSALMVIQPETGKV